MKELENSNRKTFPQQKRGLLIRYLYCVLLLLLLLVLGFWYCFSAIYFSTPFFLPLQKKALGKACILLVLLVFLSSRVVVLQNGNWRGTRLNQHSA